jgi:hypothetical protein
MERRQNHIAKQFRPNENCEQSGNTYSCCVVAPVGSPPPKLTGGVSAFPDNATKIFLLPQNRVSLAFNATKSQPHSPRIWRRLRRIFAKLMKERKEALRKFLRMNGIDKEVVVQPKVQRWWENRVKRKKRQVEFTEKPPPLHSAIWLLGVVFALRRAPNPCLRVAG